MDSPSFVYPEHFQPECVLFGCVPNKVRAFDNSLRSIALSEIDQMGALRTKDEQSQA